MKNITFERFRSECLNELEEMRKMFPTKHQIKGVEILAIQNVVGRTMKEEKIPVGDWMYCDDFITMISAAYDQIFKTELTDFEKLQKHIKYRMRDSREKLQTAIENKNIDSIAIHSNKFVELKQFLNDVESYVEAFDTTLKDAYYE